MPEDFDTSYSLLGRALDTGDQGAWNELMAKYESFVYYLLRKSKIREGDLDDVAQEVSLELCKHLKTFDPNKGRFRTWFGVIIRTKIAHYFRKLVAQDKKIDNFRNEYTFFAESDDAKLDAHIEQEWKDYVTIEALKRVETSYTGKAVEVFRRGLDGESIQETAEALGISENSVYSYRQRVKKSLRKEVRQLVIDLEGKIE